MTRLFRSLSFRLALTYAGLFAGSLLLLLGAYYIVVIRMPLREAEKIVQYEADLLANIYIVDGEAALVRRLRARDAVHERHRAFHAFIDTHGRIVTTNLPSWPRAPTVGWRRLEADISIDGDEIDFEALTLDRRFDDGARLIVGRDIDNISERERAMASLASLFIGRDIDDINQRERGMAASASLMVGAAIFLGIVGGLLMSRSIGARVDLVAATARKVMAGDLSDRVPTDGSGDEFDQLAALLNAMLQRIETSMESVRRVSDSVAHELRTPLARLRASLEDAASADGAQAPALFAALAEAERLDAIFDAVLRISRIETGSISIEMADVDLTALIEDVADFYLPEAEARGLTLATTIAPGLHLAGSKDLLFQAIANLIDNAIKHASPGGMVTVIAACEGENVAIFVRDDGGGVDESDLPRITERFYRARNAPRDTGNGLGLSLVDAVARLHRSRLGFANRRPGFEVSWWFAPATPHQRPPIQPRSAAIGFPEQG